MRKVGNEQGMSKNLSKGIRNLGLVTDVARVKGCVVVALDNVKDSDGVTTRDQSLNYVTAKETAAANNEKRVALWW